ncbi:class I SAM-dependent methyltransferase [Paenibacillus daejeonensis]|uniref:class I SAM-dependent methyltransferase n=1 Tax=Paenibacillus daejeonensis TaxID=135193 RepID=UPI00036BBFF0|nr:class I SAM-dependent methyltransferase [Paenibacillus daejeonensis]
MHTYGELCTEVYEISKPVGFSYGDVEYYKERLQHVSGRVLEVACGSGRVMIPLLQHGIAIEGVDNAPAMLEAGRRNGRRLGVEPILHHGEMSRFSLDASYEAIIIPGGSIQLIETREELLQALQCFRTHMQEQSVLILDTFLPTDYNLDTTKTRMWETEDGDAITLEEKRIEVDFINQRILSLLRYDKWRDGSLVQSELQRLPLCWYGVDEFRLLLESTGFTDVTVTGNYKHGSPPSEAGSMITYEASK